MFLFEAINQNNFENPIPDEIKTIILLEARDPGFRDLVSNSEVDNVYSLLYPQIDYRFNVSICDWLNSNCENKELDNFKRKENMCISFQILTKHFILN